MNIGLIAMSGIRTCDTELLELGLTLPGFVERSKTIASLPSLGLLNDPGIVEIRKAAQERMTNCCWAWCGKCWTAPTAV